MTVAAGDTTVTDNQPVADLVTPAAVGLAYNPVSQRLYAALDTCQEISISQPERGLEVRYPLNIHLIKP